MKLGKKFFYFFNHSSVNNKITRCSKASKTLKLHQIQNNPHSPIQNIIQIPNGLQSTETNLFLSSNFPTTQTHTPTKFKHNILVQIILVQINLGNNYTSTDLLQSSSTTLANITITANNSGFDSLMDQQRGVTIVVDDEIWASPGPQSRAFFVHHQYS